MFCKQTIPDSNTVVASSFMESNYLLLINLKTNALSIIKLLWGSKGRHKKSGGFLQIRMITPQQ